MSSKAVEFERASQTVPLDRDTLVTLKPASLAHVGRIETLDRHHGDPFDRLLIAQTLVEYLPVVTADPIFRKHGVKRIS